MSDLISRQAAIDAILEDLDFDSVKELRAYVSKNKQDDYFYGGILHAINAVQDLSPEQPVARDTNVLSNDTISRQAAKLKPCPFCGSEAVYETFSQEYALGTKNPEIFCNSCKAIFSVEDSSPFLNCDEDYKYRKRITVEAWNRRAYG